MYSFRQIYSTTNGFYAPQYKFTPIIFNIYLVHWPIIAIPLKNGIIVIGWYSI